MKNIHGLLLVGCSALALAGCGPSDIASPGTGGNVTINNNTTNPTPTPTPTPTSGGVTPAAGCPTITDPQGLTDDGTITGPEGEWRVCTLPSRINKSITLPKIAGLLYQLAGRVDVGTDGGFSDTGADTNVTLTIEPGVIVYGGVGVSWLAVNRGNKINAVGTPTLPIIFTSRDNVLGLNTENSSAQWGGVVLMGRGVITDCNYGSVGAGTCERDTEGAADPAIFGGSDDTYNAGKMQYVQIRYSGYVLSADKELQSLTPEGNGSGTTIDHFMTYNSSDDGIEFFGGVTNMKYYVAVGAEDDSLDVDTGARVNVQYAILAQRPNVGDTMMEIDSNGLEEDTPRTNIKVSNFVYYQRKTGNSDEASMLYRGNSDVTLMNGIVVSPDDPCLRIHNSFTTAAFHSVEMQCGSPKYINSGSAAANAAENFFNAGQDNNSDSYTPTFTSLFINGTNESGVPAYDPTQLSSFFDAVSYIGAVKDASDDWYAGWTCNSSAASFGSGNTGQCTALPTY